MAQATRRATFVTHRTRWGNPYYSGPQDDRPTAVKQYAAWIDGKGPDELWLNGFRYRRPTRAEIIEHLRGHDLVCYCPLDQPCHADLPAYAQRGRGERKRSSSGWASFAPAELDVVCLVSGGLPNHTSPQGFSCHRTVPAHLTHVYTKLSLTSRVQLGQEAARHP